MQIEFEVPGQPVAKGRPKFARRGKFVTTYTPEKTRTYEELVSWCAKGVMMGNDPMQGAIYLYLVIGLQIPKSWSNKKRIQAELGEIPAIKKPDADNVLKAVKDAMNGIVYADDSQITMMTIIKKYSPEPKVKILVCTIGNVV